MNTSTSTFPVNGDKRADILVYASNLLGTRDRAPDAVLAAAQPLLDWAAEACSTIDLHFRMRAMSRVNCNEQLRLSDRAGDTGPVRLTPREFVDRAITYYGFITG